MTNDELKALCERVIETCERMRDIGLPLMIGDSAISLSQECLKLLAQCEAMRGVVEAASFVAKWPHFYEGQGITELQNALSQLGDGV